MELGLIKDGAMKFYLVIILSLLFTSCGKNSDLYDFFNGGDGSGGSSIPEGYPNGPTTAEIEEGAKDISLNVLVFPHTLANDGAHGPADLKDRVRFESSQKFYVNFEKYSILTNALDLKLRKGKLSFTLHGSSYLTSQFNIVSKDVVKIVRENALEKSHSYLGNFSVRSFQGREIRVINKINLESYLRGVVPSESVPTWPEDALKAQSLAARSYAYYHYKTAPKNREYHVDDTARYQVYTGISEAKASTDQAIKETAREVITYNNEVIVAFFHSYSGGHLDPAHEIFGGKFTAYTQKTSEIFSAEELKENIPERSQWIIEWGPKSFTKEHILKRLKASSRTSKLFKNFDQSQVYGITITEEDDRNETVKKLFFRQGKNTAVIDRVDFRSALGWSKVLSYHFKLRVSGSNVLVTGYGWGHHVGMSQFGAFMMALKGYDYQDIIRHYYKDVEITKY